jgi:hypothetical protein
MGYETVRHGLCLFWQIAAAGSDLYIEFIYSQLRNDRRGGIAASNLLFR